MPQTYKFVVSMPVDSLLPRDRQSNTLHFQHSIGSVADTALDTMCADIIGVYQARYAHADKELTCKAYDVDAKPNYPRAVKTVNPGIIWEQLLPHEIALCLSYAGTNRGNKAERGRIYLNPCLYFAQTAILLRPSQAQMDWALGFYSTSNASFPDVGGVDWQFGVWSKTYQKFTQTKQAWSNDEWDTQRRRGLRETTRRSIARDG